jgi:hypothetical protein
MIEIEWDWNAGRPTPEDVKKWGYDEELLFLQQDEDLVLHESEFITVLIELSADESCPKKEFCLSILYYYIQILFCHRNIGELEECYQNMMKYKGQLTSHLDRWQKDFFILKRILNDPHPVSSEEADKIATLLCGVRTVEDFDTGATITTSADWQVFDPSIVIRKLKDIKLDYYQYQMSRGGYARHLYINSVTGIWKFDRHYPLSDSDLKNSN